jgi:hypothetical protein
LRGLRSDDRPGDGPELLPHLRIGNRLIEAHDEQAIKAYEQVGVKKKRPGEKKPYEEIKIGDDLHRNTGQWNRLERIIDRNHDRYFEHIEDAAGNPIRHCDEPLSQHQGRGSAKQPKNSPRNSS